MGQQLGDKIGPRLARLVLAHHLAARKAMAPVESKIAAAASQQLIDRAGHEVAAHYRPLLQQLLDKHPAMAPHTAEFLQRTMSGHDQWQAIAGVVGMSTLQGGLSSVLTNELAPAVQQLLYFNPNIHIDQNAAAYAAARRILDKSDAAATAAQAGFDTANFEALFASSQVIPGAADLYDLRNRGIITDAELTGWLQRAGLPDELVRPMEQLRAQLVSPADAALAVLRGNMTLADGQAAAAAAGVSAANFAVLLDNTGEPPAVEEMLMLWRRGKIDTPTLDRAISQSRVRNEWIPAIHDLATAPPSAAEVITALAQGQIEEPEARQRWAEAGGDPTWFTSAWNTANSAPTPVELSVMANRGIIPWDGAGAAVTSFHQGFLEGPWRNKWEDAFRQLAAYRPSPREVTTLIHEAGMGEAEAETLWRQAGLTPQMAHYYWTAAHYQRTSALHNLSVSEIRQLYGDRAVDRKTALQMLESVNWSATDAEYLLDLADFQLERKFLELAISKIASLFVGHHIDKNAAAAALGKLEVPATQAQQLIKIWALEAAANVKSLTEAQVTQAYYYEIMKYDEASTRLQALGYSPRDAWIILSIKIKAPIKNPPEPGA